MKKITFIAFIVFCSVIGTLLALDFIQKESAQIVVKTDLGSKFNLIEVAKHNNKESCWMAIDRKVYDLTSYVPRHPTAQSVILNWCGKDATEGMYTKGYGRNHSPRAWEMLERYLIGELS
jgi:cytochrome b involved in lipid metabolism